MGVGAFLPYFNTNDPKAKKKTQSGNILDHLSVGPYLRFEIKNVKVNMSIVTSLINSILNTINNIYINCNTTIMSSYEDIKVYFIEKKYLNQTSFRPPVPTFTAFTMNRNNMNNHNHHRRKVLKRKKSKTHSAVSTLRSYVKDWMNINHHHHNISSSNNTINITKNFSLTHNGQITPKKNNSEKYKKKKEAQAVNEYDTDKDRKTP